MKTHIRFSVMSILRDRGGSIATNQATGKSDRSFVGACRGAPVRSTLRNTSRNLFAAAIFLACCQGVNAQTAIPNNAKIMINGGTTQAAVPNDAISQCPVSATIFKGWFASGAVTLNGIVNPASSVAFPNIPNCTFYQWAEQMFLWLTSPAPSNYGQGSHVFNSPVFYNVSPIDANGQRTLTPNSPGGFILNPKISQLGPAAKPVVFDKTGKMFTVVSPELSPNNKPLIRNKAGEPIEIQSTQIAPNGKVIFLDKAGKAIDFQVSKNGSPRLLASSGQEIDLQPTHIVINGKTFLLDSAGNVVETEPGQADGGVLMANGNKLVYYALQVNDVYAYFMTGTKNCSTAPNNLCISGVPPTRFPTTTNDRNAIHDYGLAHSKSFPDLDALAVELKSSWVEAAGLDTSKYVTTMATIPIYASTVINGKMTWVPNGTKQALVALVGIHVVGSATGHPEMIWATFEHVGNTRNAFYTYTSTSGNKTVPQNNGGTWLFSKTPPMPSPMPNAPLMHVVGANIVANNTPPGIVPGDILRVNPWGTASTSGSFIANNSDLIAINSSVITQLAAGDVRQNYIMTGTTWTAGGGVPPPGSGTPKGTDQMANTTMETFFNLQHSNCFDCHNGSNMLGSPGGGGLSHIWGTLKQLFP
jgi:hypothetical protein